MSIVFCYDNALVDSILTTTDQDYNYPLENIYDTRLSKIYRSLTSSIRIVYDAGSGNTLTPNAVTINAHNISASATIKIEGNATNSWGSPSLSQTMTYSADCIIKFFTGAAYRYWSIYIDDPTNPDGYIQIGHSFLGSKLSLLYTVNTDLGFSIQENSKKTVSPTGQTYGHNSATWLKIFDLSLEGLANTEKNNILTMYDYTRNFIPFYLIIDDDHLTELPVFYCTIDNELSFKMSAGYTWGTKIVFKESR